jgi:hypothetical protein
MVLSPAGLGPESVHLKKILVVGLKRLEAKTELIGGKPPVVK